MTSSTWERQRSDLNHGWLKNRLLMSLARYRRVCMGEVRDDFARDDLAKLLEHWPDVRSSLRELVEESQSRINRPTNPIEADVSRLGRDVCEYLLDVERLCWCVRALPETRNATVTASLKCMDEAITRLYAGLQSASDGVEREAVDAARAKARELSSQISELTISRDVIFEDNE